MIWRRPAPPPARPARHGRHGRLGRSDVVRPPLPALDSRTDRFDLVVSMAADFLRENWEELRDVRFDVGGMPSAADADGIPRWSVDRDGQRITVYRIAIELLDRPHRIDDLHGRMMIEGAVFRAAAEYLERDPWDLGLDRFRPE